MMMDTDLIISEFKNEIEIATNHSYKSINGTQLFFEIIVSNNDCYPINFLIITHYETSSRQTEIDINYWNNHQFENFIENIQKNIPCTFTFIRTEKYESSSFKIKYTKFNTIILPINEGLYYIDDIEYELTEKILKELKLIFRIISKIKIES